MASIDLRHSEPEVISTYLDHGRVDNKRRSVAKSPLNNGNLADWRAAVASLGGEAAGTRRSMSSPESSGEMRLDGAPMGHRSTLTPLKS